MASTYPRTFRGVLDALAHAGLARVGVDGRWVAHTSGEARELADHDPIVRAARVRAHHTWLEAHDQITRERVQHRSHTTSRWSQQRAAAHQHQLEKARAWRARFTPDAWEIRREHHRARFAALTQHQQQTAKTQFVRERAHTHTTQAERHQAWWDAIDPVVYDERSQLFRQRYRALTRDEKKARIEALDRHRAAYNIPRLPRKLPHQDPLPAAA